MSQDTAAAPPRPVPRTEGLLAACAAVVMAAVLVISLLQYRAEDARETRLDLSEFASHVQRVHALEWEAVAAGGVTDRLVGEVNQDMGGATMLAGHILTRHRSFHGEALFADLQIYGRALNQEFAYLAAHRQDEAKRIDAVGVDPMFGRLAVRLEAAQKRAKSLEATSGRAATTGSGVIVLVCALIVGALLARYVRIRRDADVADAEQRAVVRSEGRYRSLARNVADLILVLDAGRVVVYATESSRRVLGCEPGALLGRGFREMVAPQSAEAAAVVLGSAGPEEPASADLWLVPADGRARQCEAAVLDLSGDPAVEGLVVTLRDVTERRQLEEGLRHSQRMEAVGRLAGGVAHDFNNLVTVILGSCELLRTRAGSLGENDRYLDDIERAGHRAAGLTRQLLAFSRKQRLKLVTLDVRAVLRDMSGMLRRLIGEHIELSVEIPHAPCRVHADAGQVEQAIMNLVVNARDAMPRGGSLALEVEETDVAPGSRREGVPVAPGGYVVVRVRDTGIGMEESVRSRVFEPFFTTKGVGAGTGLGLATVYGIVKQFKGYVFVESAPGRGSTFEVLLPRSAPGDSDSPGDARRSADISRRGIETVLLVEDEGPVRELAREILSRRGYRVLEAANGLDALETAEQHRGNIHLLFTDVVMPRLGGPELAAALKARRPDIRVLYTSGYSEAPGRDPGWLEGGNFLQKPFRPDSLLSAVRETLDAA